jgi:hypothetical protein
MALPATPTARLLRSNIVALPRDIPLPPSAIPNPGIDFLLEQMRNPSLPMYLRIECACRILDLVGPEYFPPRFEARDPADRLTIRITDNPGLGDASRQRSS